MQWDTLKETDMIQDRLTAKFLKNKTAAPKVKAEKKSEKPHRAPAAVDTYLAGTAHRATVWI